MTDQLEFDLVAPGLAGLTEKERELLNEAAALRRIADKKVLLAKISVQLRNQDRQLARTDSNELEELRVLVGRESWKKESRHWKRRLQRNPRAVRKTIVVLRNLTRTND